MLTCNAWIMLSAALTQTERSNRIGGTGSDSASGSRHFLISFSHFPAASDQFPAPSDHFPAPGSHFSRTAFLNQIRSAR